MDLGHASTVVSAEKEKLGVLSLRSILAFLKEQQ